MSVMPAIRTFAADARHGQIGVLTTLLGLQLFWADFGPTPQAITICLSVAVLAQLAGLYFVRAGHFDIRSALISGLALSILFRADDPLIYALPASVAIASKFLVRINGKHIFNPANIGIVACLAILPHHVWVSPGQWGNELWLATFLGLCALFILQRVPSRDITFTFLASYAAIIFGRHLSFGDPLAIPLNKLESGALLIFAFFMISDPKSTPDHRLARVIFAVATAIMACILQFEFRSREGLFYALALVSLMTPLLDRGFRAGQFHWPSRRRAT